MITLNKEQLLKKFQLAHFIGVRALPSSMYEHIADFEKNIHGVNLGGGYLRRVACTEMIHFLAKDILYRNITNLLNSGEKHFYSLLSNGSSNAKTMDEKELVLIKTCDQGRPVFHVLVSGTGNLFCMTGNQNRSMANLFLLLGRWETISGRRETFFKLKG